MVIQAVRGLLGSALSAITMTRNPGLGVTAGTWLSARTRGLPQEPAPTRGRRRKTNPEGLVFPLLVVGRYQRANELGVAIPGPE